MKTKTYILQKDTLRNLDNSEYFIKKGTKVIFNGNEYQDYLGFTYNKVTVENHPEWFLEETIKPPIGVIPIWLWKEQRLSDLHQAAKMYRMADVDIPNELEEEIINLASEIQNIKNGEK